MALLIMDYQQGIVERFANDPFLLQRAQTAIGAARAVGIPIIYVVVKFRENYPEISPNNAAFSGLKASGMAFDENSPATQVHAAVAPQPGDITVVKRRVGAFTGSDLEVVLRSLGITTVVMGGIATSGVVLSTLRAAADMDYKIVVLSDCCADGDAEVHRVLLEKVFVRQAQVVTVGEWTQQLSAQA